MIPAHFSPPTQAHLQRAYAEMAALGAGAGGKRSAWPYRPSDREETFAVCAELSRYDPRLFEILVNYVRRHWEALSWLPLRRAVRSLPTPQVFGVIGELLWTADRHAELRACCRLVMDALPPVRTQFFYHLQYTPGSRLAQRAVNHRLREFERWGFLASERPIIEQSNKAGVGQLSRTARMGIVHRLLAEGQGLALRDYLQALPQRISRQQALADLRTIPGLRPSGHGRGARWTPSGRRP